MKPPLHHPALEIALLVLIVAACWIGVVGMWRMREPMQALHYMSIPASVCGVALTLAAFLETGSSQIAWKTVVVALLLFGINSVGTHAAARAFRARELGHWEPRDGDPIELVRDDGERGEEQ